MGEYSPGVEEYSPRVGEYFCLDMNMMGGGRTWILDDSLESNFRLG